MATEEATEYGTMFSPLMSALHGKRISLADIPERGDAITAYSLLHLRLQRRILVTLDAIASDSERRIKEGYDTITSGNPYFTLDSFQDAVYRAAEIFEFYEKDLPIYLNLANPTGQLRSIRAQYLTAIRRAKRIWSFLCNKCKHNHAFLTYAEGKYEGGKWVCGFSMYRRVGNLLKIESSLHHAAEVFSYNWALRRLFTDILGADVAASELVTHAVEGQTNIPLKTHQIPLPYSGVLKRISEWPKIQMPRENKYFLTDIVFRGEEITIEQAHSSVPKGNFKMHMIFDILGDKAKAELPYELGNIDFHLKSEMPLDAFYRVVVQDLVVQPESIDDQT